ncbi:MAG: hypothetical protein AB7G23_20200 [Vicinamibacterales bacterium]
MTDELPPDPLPGIADREDRMLLAGLDARAAALAAGATPDEALAAGHEAIGWAQVDETHAAVAQHLADERARLEAKYGPLPDPAATTDGDGEASS